MGSWPSSVTAISFRRASISSTEKLDANWNKLEAFPAMHLASESGETLRGPAVTGPGVHRRRVVLHRRRPLRHAVRVRATHAVEAIAKERLVADLPRGTVGHLGLVF